MKSFLKSLDTAIAEAISQLQDNYSDQEKYIIKELALASLEIYLNFYLFKIDSVFKFPQTRELVSEALENPEKIIDIANLCLLEAMREHPSEKFEPIFIENLLIAYKSNTSPLSEKLIDKICLPVFIFLKNRTKSLTTLKKIVKSTDILDHFEYGKYIKKGLSYEFYFSKILILYWEKNKNHRYIFSLQREQISKLLHENYEFLDAATIYKKGSFMANMYISQAEIAQALLNKLGRLTLLLIFVAIICYIFKFFT